MSTVTDTIRAALLAMPEDEASTLQGIYVERRDRNNWIIGGRVWPIAGAVAYIERNGAT